MFIKVKMHLIKVRKVEVQVEVESLGDNEQDKILEESEYVTTTKVTGKSHVYVQRKDIDMTKVNN